MQARTYIYLYINIMYRRATLFPAVAKLYLYQAMNTVITYNYLVQARRQDFQPGGANNLIIYTYTTPTYM